MNSAPSPGVSAVPLWNVANVLTAARLAAVPLFCVALLVNGGHDPVWRWVATGIFVLASITDHYDGKLARERGLVTDVGKIADPIADKALTGGALICLSVLGDVAWWITVLIVLREVGITALRFAVIRRGVIAASMGGKIKTVLLIVAIVLYVQPLWFVAAPLHVLAAIVLYLALAAALLTGADYVVRVLRARGEAR